MLISIRELKTIWRVNPEAILHIGAHLAEERNSYKIFGNVFTIWIEAQPELCEKLRVELNPRYNRIIEAAIWNENDLPLKLHVSSNSQSSSLLEPGTHITDYPSISFEQEIEVKTKRVDSLISSEEMPNFLNIDIQGAESQAIESLGELIGKVKYFFIEVNKREVYKGCILVKDLDKQLSKLGFRRVTTRWVYKKGWGDALYIRRKALSFIIPRQVISKCLSMKFVIKHILIHHLNRFRG